MRKSMKLLAILLLACVFVSVMVIGASAVTAADLDSTTLASKYENNKNYFQLDFTTNSGTPQTEAPEVDYNFDWTGFSVYETKTKGDNTYASVSNAETPTAPTTMADGFAGVVFKGPNINMNQIYDNNKSYLLYDIDLANISLDSNISYAAVGFLGGSFSHQILAYIVPNGGEYYVSLDTAYDANDIKLSSETDVWNHITVAYTNYKVAAKFFVFVDGEYLGYNAAPSGYHQFKHPTVVVGGITEPNYDVDFNIDFDNIAVNTYWHTDMTTSALTTFRGFLPALNGGTQGTAKIYNCVEAIYNKNYTYTSPAEGQAIVKIDYATIDDVSYDTLAAFYAASINASDLNGATITIRRDVDITALSTQVTSLTVICKDGAKPTYDTTTWGSVVPSSNDGVDTYTFGAVVPPADPEVEVNFKANLTLLDEFKFNVYVPADVWTEVVSAKIGGVDVVANDATINEVAYKVISHPIKANAAKDSFTLALELAGGTEEYTFSIPGYIEKVRAGECTAVVEALMAATENYINAVYNYAKSESNTVVTTYVPTKTGTTADKFTNVKIGLALTDSIVFQFTATTATEMSFEVPVMENGEFIYKAIATDGAVTSFDVVVPVRFLNDGIIINAEGATGTFYIDDYIRAMAGDADANLVALTNAIGAYAKAANDYARS